MSHTKANRPRPAGPGGPEPFPYPNGWFAACFSHEIAPGDVHPVPFMGGDLVVYRTRAGVAHAVDPYCPHLGAHLGYGGRLDGENLVCPFHGLSFGPDGACVRSASVPRPPQASLHAWLVQERYGMVLIWRDHAGRLPDWDLPDIDATGFSPPRGSCYELDGHAHDAAENATDLSHFVCVHGFTDVAMTYETDRHRMVSILTARWHRVPIRIHMTSYGVGCTFGEAEIPRFGVRVRTRAFGTPTAPLKWTFRWSDILRISRVDALPAALRAPLYALLIRLAHHWFVYVVREDFPIWAHRCYVEHPKLMTGDEPLAAFRRWMRQFYPGDPASRTIAS